MRGPGLWRGRRAAAALLPLVLVAVSCAAPGGSPATTGPTAAPGSTTTTTEADGSTTTTAAADTTTTTLPGEPIDLFVDAGDVLAVVGVEHDDVLNVRAAPGTDQEIVATLEPLADDVVATGRARALSRSIWYEVEVDDTTGWASIAFLAFLGSTDDVTSQVLDALGERPEAETMLELGRVVAEAVASEEPASRITVTVAPTVGDLGEVTYDVVGLGDDAVFGLRLHVFGEPDDGGEGFTLRTVEQTLLCARGVDDGLCV